MQGAATTPMALRRRNPKGGRHFAGAGWIVKSHCVYSLSGRRRLKNAGLDTRIHFSAPCHNEGAAPPKPGRGARLLSFSKTQEGITPCEAASPQPPWAPFAR
jgi:hypothetical protein